MTATFGTIRPKLTKKNMSVQKPERKPISDDTFGLRKLDYIRQTWDSLAPFRREIERATRYFNGDQWHEKTTDRYGRVTTEGDHISSQGQTPIVHNEIKPICRSLQGLLRSSGTKSIVVARTPEKAKQSEMLSNTLQCCLESINDSKEVDSTTFEKYLLSGIGIQRLSYEYITDIKDKDVLINDMDLYSMFFNGNIRDVRGYDINLIGRLMDLTLDELIMYFGKTPQREETLRNIYSGHTEQLWSVPEGLSSTDYYSKDFYIPSDISKCRVIECWEKRTFKVMNVHDWMDGKIYYTDWTKQDIKALNNDRIQKYAEIGVPAEDVLLYEGTEETIQKWFYTYYSPYGHILEEGESYLKHGSHPYSVFIHKISDGKITGLVTDLIDIQRQFNRVLILRDRILASATKNLMVIDSNSADGRTREELMDDIKEPGSVLLLDLKKGQAQPPQEIRGSVGDLGTNEMLQIFMRSFQDISGVHPAMQGQQASSGTSGKLYQQQAQNSTLNSKDIMDSFAAGQRRRDMKLLNTIQQYYDTERMIAIAGKSSADTAQKYDPKELNDIKFTMAIGQSTDSPIFRGILDDQLFQMLMQKIIDLEMFLENTSMPMAGNLLESVRKRKADLQQDPNNINGTISGLSSDIMQATPGANQNVVNAVHSSIKNQEA